MQKFSSVNAGAIVPVVVAVVGGRLGLTIVDLDDPVVGKPVLRFTS